MGLGVEFDGRAQGAGQGLEAALGDMVAVVAIEGFQVHAGAQVHGEGVVEFLEQLGVDLADLLGLEGDLPDQIGPVGEIDGAAGQGLVHRDIGVAEAADSLEAVQGLVDGLADDDARVLHRVVEIDVQIALGADLQIDAAVTGEAVEHVVEEANAGLDIGHAGAVQIDADADLGFLGVADDVGRAGHGLKVLSPPPGLSD